MMEEQRDQKEKVFRTFEGVFSKESKFIASAFSASRHELNAEYKEFLLLQERDREEQRRLEQARLEKGNKWNRRPENQMSLAEIKKRKKEQREGSRQGSTLTLSTYSSNMIGASRSSFSVKSEPNKPTAPNGTRPASRTNSNFSTKSEPALLASETVIPTISARVMSTSLNVQDKEQSSKQNLPQAPFMNSLLASDFVVVDIDLH